jgi:hypothetical protein
MHDKSYDRFLDISDPISDEITNFLYKLYILINARRLGWTANIKDGQIILTKKTNSQSDIDRDTPTLMKLLTGI